MNKYVSPKAELVLLSIQNVIMASAETGSCPLDISGPGLNDGTKGQTLDTQSLV